MANFVQFKHGFEEKLIETINGDSISYLSPLKETRRKEKVYYFNIHFIGGNSRLFEWYDLEEAQNTHDLLVSKMDNFIQFKDGSKKLINTLNRDSIAYISPIMEKDEVVWGDSNLKYYLEIHFIGGNSRLFEWYDLEEAQNIHDLLVSKMDNFIQFKYGSKKLIETINRDSIAYISPIMENNEVEGKEKEYYFEICVGGENILYFNWTTLEEAQNIHDLLVGNKDNSISDADECTGDNDCICMKG